MMLLINLPWTRATSLAPCSTVSSEDQEWSRLQQRNFPVRAVGVGAVAPARRIGVGMVSEVAVAQRTLTLDVADAL